MEDHIDSASDTINSDSTPKSKDLVLIPTINLVTSSMNWKESM
jgi:hypothetical protein